MHPARAAKGKARLASTVGSWDTLRANAQKKEKGKGVARLGTALERGARAKIITSVGKRDILPGSAPKRERARGSDRDIRARAREDGTNRLDGLER